MKTARELLDEIVEFLNQPNSLEVQKLWDVLTALRGPDYDDLSTVKEITIARLRNSIGLKFRSNRTVSSGPLETVSLAQFSLVGCHFIRHYEKAIDALVQMGYIESLPYGNHPTPKWIVTRPEN